MISSFPCSINNHCLTSERSTMNLWEYYSCRVMGRHKITNLQVLDATPTCIKGPFGHQKRLDILYFLDMNTLLVGHLASSRSKPTYFVRWPMTIKQKMEHAWLGGSIRFFKLWAANYNNELLTLCLSRCHARQSIMVLINCMQKHYLSYLPLVLLWWWTWIHAL